jgi:hypothetical protein
MKQQVVTQLKLLLPDLSVDDVHIKKSVLSGEYRKKVLAYGVA